MINWSFFCQNSFSSFIMSELVLKGLYHESVRYAAISLTTVQWERCFPLSERNKTASLVTSQISREGSGVTTYQKVADAVVNTPL